MNKLTLVHVRNVEHMAKRFTDRTPNLPNWLYEELVSIGLLTLVDLAPKFDLTNTPGFDGFIMKRVKWAMLDLIRQQYWTSKDKKPKYEVEELHERFACVEADQEDMVNRTILSRALARLSSRQRIILIRYYWEGWTQKEIGDMLGVNESRVSQLKTEALQTLRGRFGRN